jgi:hypothetical protein
MSDALRQACSLQTSQHAPQCETLYMRAHLYSQPGFSFFQEFCQGPKPSGSLAVFQDWWTILVMCMPPEDATAAWRWLSKAAPFRQMLPPRPSGARLSRKIPNRAALKGC